MKHFLAAFAVVALSAAVIPASGAQGSDMKDMDMGKEKKSASEEKRPPVQTHKASGTVTKVDRASGRVSIAHGPIQSLKWPGMTMTFGVKDKTLLDKLPSGKRVEFEFVKQGPDYVVTSVK